MTEVLPFGAKMAVAIVSGLVSSGICIGGALAIYARAKTWAAWLGGLGLTLCLALMPVFGGMALWW